jgi:hypothetical protein
LAKPEHIDPAFVQLAKAKVQAVMIMPAGWFDIHMPAIVASALAQRWPAVGVQPSIPARGLLRRPHSQRRQARRSARRTANRLRAGAQPEDRRDAGHRDSAVDAAARHEVDRMNPGAAGWQPARPSRRGLMRKEGERLILTPIRKNRLLELLASWTPLDEGLPEVQDLPPQQRAEL